MAVSLISWVTLIVCLYIWSFVHCGHIPNEVTLTISACSISFSKICHKGDMSQKEKYGIFLLCWKLHPYRLLYWEIYAMKIAFMAEKWHTKRPLFFLPGEGGQSGFGVDRGEWLFESVILLSRVLLKTAAIEKIDLIKDLACPPKPED